MNISNGVVTISWVLYIEKLSLTSVHRKSQKIAGGKTRIHTQASLTWGSVCNRLQVPVTDTVVNLNSWCVVWMFPLLLKRWLKKKIVCGFSQHLPRHRPWSRQPVNVLPRSILLGAKLTRWAAWSGYRAHSWTFCVRVSLALPLQPGLGIWDILIFSSWSIFDWITIPRRCCPRSLLVWFLGLGARPFAAISSSDLAVPQT